MRLGRTFGHVRWWELKDEHTPFQWALQRVASIVDPCGPERDDMRGAYLTEHILATQMVNKPDEAQFQQDVKTLSQYLKTADDFESDDDLAALEILKQKGG